MADELSDTELAALLAQGPPGTRGVRRAPARTALSYDFKRPQRIQKDQLRAVESLHEQYTRLVSASLASAMRLVVDVDIAFVDQLPFAEFAASLGTPCCAYSFTMTPPEGTVVLNLAHELAMALVDRAFGGRGRALTDTPRPLTPIETNVLNKVASRLCRDLESAWAPIARMEVSDLVLETNSEFLQAANGGETVLVVAFEVTAAHATGLLHLAYPVSAFEEPLQQLLQRSGKRPAREAPQARQPSPALDRVQIDLMVQLARGTLALGDLAALRAGDVVRLDTTRDEPAVVFVGGQPKFLGRAGLDGRRRAVKLARAIDPEDEEAFR